ncbi:MAG: tRNA (guanosine(37)-N1)-methyltransferase TrmD [Planctomycetota bacterium]|nr:tRNA (guanosine(37)-N1)-methyltransferase TrmD [Planctomycetota bacterium]
MPARFDILTLFPEMFPAVLGASILGRAAENGLAAYHVHNIRDWADNRHRKVDDRPFGGGPGMVMMCQPLHDCVHAVEQMDERPARRILLTPQGEPLQQQRVEQLADEERLLLIAGHYEGVDERVIEALEPMQISVGDYVLSGGELPAMMLLDAIVRLIPGALGHEDSAGEDSFALRTVNGACGDQIASAAGAGPGGRRLLDCPHYTRPRVWEGRAVPDVLLSGDHQAVAEWRMQMMIERTRKRRPDLFENQPTSPSPISGAATQG